MALPTYNPKLSDNPLMIHLNLKLRCTHKPTPPFSLMYKTNSTIPIFISTGMASHIYATSPPSPKAPHTNKKGGLEIPNLPHLNETSV